MRITTPSMFQAEIDSAENEYNANHQFHHTQSEFWKCTKEGTIEAWTGQRAPCISVACEIREKFKKQLKQIQEWIIDILRSPEKDPQYFYRVIYPAYQSSVRAFYGYQSALDQVIKIADQFLIPLFINNRRCYDVGRCLHPEEHSSAFDEWNWNFRNGFPLHKDELSTLEVLWSNDQTRTGYQEWCVTTQDAHKPTPCATSYPCAFCDHWYCVCMVRADNEGAYRCLWCHK